jgi:hypothetical protein
MTTSPVLPTGSKSRLEQLWLTIVNPDSYLLLVEKAACFIYMLYLQTNLGKRLPNQFTPMAVLGTKLAAHDCDT